MPLPPLEDQIPGDYQLDALLRGWALQRAWHRARMDLVATVMPPSHASPSLDLAAGSGLLTWRFPDAPVVSVDLRLDACRSIRRHTPGARTVVAELSELPFQAATFSQLYFLETLEHLTPDEGRRVLEEMRRVSRPDGRCLITTPNYRSHWVVLESMLDALRMTPRLTEAQHVSRYDGAALANVVDTTGWRVLRRGSFNLLAPFAGMVSRRMARRIVHLEATSAAHAGALLYAVCEPRS